MENPSPNLRVVQFERPSERPEGADPPTERVGFHPEPGRLVAERYRLVEPLGEGGFGSVWRAVDTCLSDQPVALKLLPPALMLDELAQREFKREARVAMSLSHPRLLRLHCLEFESGQPFLVMELLNGPTLTHVLLTRGRLAPEEVRLVGVQVCEGLAHAHAERVVHLDLKPSNLMLSSPPPLPEAPLTSFDPRLKITDFGIARILADTTAHHDGRPAVGTLSYMSPELICGGPVDARSDIYSLGCVLYQLVSGRKPFSAGDLTHQHLRERPARIADCPDDLWQIIAKCLAKRPEDRFQSAEDLGRALRGVPPAIRVQRVPRRVAAGAALAVLVAGTFWLGSLRRDAAPRPSPGDSVAVAEITPFPDKLYRLKITSDRLRPLAKLPPSEVIQLSSARAEKLEPSPAGPAEVAPQSELARTEPPRPREIAQEEQPPVRPEDRPAETEATPEPPRPEQPPTEERRADAEDEEGSQPREGPGGHAQQALDDFVDNVSDTLHRAGDGIQTIRDRLRRR